MDRAAGIRVLWPAGEGVESVQPSRRYMLTDERNWVSGLHGGGRSVCESARPPRPCFLLSTAAMRQRRRENQHDRFRRAAW